ncbi:MAG: ComEA family DNA-binding protein [Burkholderiales bacterium]
MKKLLLLVLVFFSFALPAWAAVDVNTATQAQLETVKGIGPAKAKAIVDYRSKNGPFKSVDDLEKVKGIGPGILKKIRAEVSVGGAAPAKAEKKTEGKKTGSPKSGGAQ